MMMNTRKQFTQRLPMTLLLMVLVIPSISMGQQVDNDKNPLGFRTDLGISLAIGGHNCIGSSGTNWLQCNGNNKGWQMGTGFSIGAVVRPFKYFSVGLDASYMALRPLAESGTEKYYNRFTDLSLGALVKGHFPVNIKRFLLDIALGLRFAAVNGFLKAEPDPEFQQITHDNSSAYYHRHFGPEITPVLDLAFFVIPKLGFGAEIRLPMTMYTSVCFDQGSSHICRGTEDDISNKVKAPVKIFYGLHMIYYL